MKTRSALLLAALLLAPTVLAAQPSAAPARATNLVGTWVLDVSFDPELDLPPFRAIQTFHAGGTMTETSDLLATLAEGPGAGAWRGEAADYEATFQLFIFDENRAPAGIIEVRERLHLETGRRLSGRAEAFLHAGGEVIPLGGGPIVGQRVRVMPLD
jgi:hypothetical protein